jgi:hypothetical protein
MLEYLTIWNQLPQDNSFKESVIRGYFKAYHRMMGLPDSDEFLNIVFMSKSIDLKFDGDYLVFSSIKDGKELDRIYANC